MRESALATGSLEKRVTAESTDAPAAKKRHRRKTSHLKIVPEARELRDQIRLQAIEIADRLDKSRPLAKEEMEAISRRLLEEIDLFLHGLKPLRRMRSWIRVKPLRLLKRSPLDRYTRSIHRHCSRRSSYNLLSQLRRVHTRYAFHD